MDANVRRQLVGRVAVDSVAGEWEGRGEWPVGVMYMCGIAQEQPLCDFGKRR